MAHSDDNGVSRRGKRWVSCLNAIQRRETNMKSAVSRYFCACNRCHRRRVFCRLPGSITTSASEVHTRACAHLCCLWSPARPPLTSPPLTRRLSDASDEPRPPSPAPSRPSTMMCVHTHGCRRASDTSPLTRIVCVHDAPLLLALSYLTSIVPISRATHTLATPSDIPRPNPYPTPCTPPSVHPTSHTIPLYEPYELLL